MEFSFDDELLRDNSIRPEDKLLLAAIKSLSIENHVIINKNFQTKVFGMNSVRLRNILKRLQDGKQLTFQEPENAKFVITLPKDKVQVVHVQDKTTAKEKPVKYKDEVKEIIEYLNQKTGRNFNPESKTNTKLIVQQLKSGYTVEDFLSVINNMCSRWKNDPKMEAYLVPGTLFAERHFDDYLNKGLKKNSSYDIIKEKQEKTNDIHGW